MTEFFLYVGVGVTCLLFIGVGIPILVGSVQFWIDFYVKIKMIREGRRSRKP